MSFKGKRILLTGATGGIGRQLAIQLSTEGARLALVGSDIGRLESLADELRGKGGDVLGIVADFKQPGSEEYVVNVARQEYGSIDILINNAGLSDFTVFEHQSLERIAEMVQVNVTTPIQLTRCLVPEFIRSGNGHIVNIGSILGSIGFPHYATYSATKYAMRGFSQALRREFQDMNIAVTYVAPRAVNTAINNLSSIEHMHATKTRLDDPELVATLIIEAVRSNRHELYIGQPESLFAWLNGFFPFFVNFGLKQKTRFARAYAHRTLTQENRL